MLDRISVGGMAEVFKAKAFGVEGFERLLAVKRILPSIAEDEEFITMFIDEAKIAVQLTHANIAQIFDLGKVGDSYFIAMEYIEGKDLRAIFDRMRKKGQTVPFPMAVYMIMKMCEGLDYAHNKKDSAGRDLNLVHRDVSPQNVLISYDGQVKVIDFGIAKAAGKAGKTQAGILKGKFGYMSPEQVRGMSLDRRSDIFAVGICLWELLTGERLFIGESDFSTLEKVRNVDIVPPSSFNKRIPQELEKIVLKALSKEVEDRYQSAMDLHDDLQSYMYTSGSFFSRKDLAAFQQEVFREDIEKNAAASEEFDDNLLKSSVPPPPRASRSGSSSNAAPPPPRVSAPPAVPRPTLGGGTIPPPAPPKPGGMVPPPPTPGGGGPAAPPAPPRVSAVPPAAKKTMLGMPAAQAQAPAPPKPSVPPPSPKPEPPKPTAPPTPSPAVSVPAPSKVSGPQGDSGLAMEWDDDEEPTNIYTKDTAAQMAAAAAAKPMGVPSPSVGPTGPAMGAAGPMGGARPLQGQPMGAPQPVMSPPGVRPMGPAAPTRIDEPLAANPARKAKNKTKSLIIGVAVGVIVAVIAVIAIFKVALAPSTGSIELNITPGDELSVVVDGSQKVPQNVSPLLIEGLSPGQHTFIINRDGFAEKELIFDVRAGKTLATNVALEEASGTGVYIESDPPGCTVEIDGKLVDDKTPLTVSDLEPGNHVVKLSKDKYADLQFEVDVEKGKQAKLPPKKLTLAKVEITFNTAPQGHKVALLEGANRVNLGVTPATYEVETGKEYEVEYTCGSKSVVRPLSRSELETGADKISMPAVTCDAGPVVGPKRVTPPVGKRPTQPAVGPAEGGGTGFLSVQTKPWSKVYINGTFVKNTPLVKKSLKAGKYNITVENEGFGIKKSFSVTIKAGQTTTLVKKLI
ncbi:MAG: protein kinase [Deltaproteobacteria bacterium]|nr:protein kinase [Deltaproteobacteria bacterium]MBN2671245.1 protein kinase [Deltaproteobacteria bacterium]